MHIEGLEAEVARLRHGLVLIVREAEQFPGEDRIGAGTMARNLLGGAIDRLHLDYLEVVGAERERIVAFIREKADNQDYATMCSWRALADTIEALLSERDEVECPTCHGVPQMQGDGHGWDEGGSYHTPPCETCGDRGSISRASDEEEH